MCGGGGGIGNIVSGVGKAIGGIAKGVVGAVKNVVKNPIFQAVAPIALNMFFPGLGAAAASALNLSAAWAPAIGGAITGGIMGGVSGKGIGGALKGAAIGGIASGIGDYLMTGNNPLSGVFSGPSANPLTAANAGSTQLTGVGSGLGIDQSTLSSQFGTPQANLINPETGRAYGSGLINATGNPAAGAGNIGGIGNVSGTPSLNANAITGPGINIAPKPGLLPTQKGSPGFLESLRGGNFVDAAKSLIPQSTMGKVALGGLGLMALQGSQKPPEMSGPPAMAQDPNFTKRLDHWRYNAGRTQNPYDPNSAEGQAWQQRNPFFNPSWANASGAQIDPGTGQPIQPNQPAAAAGGMMPYYAMGGLAQYAQGGMSDMNGMGAMDSAHGYLQGPGDGVSDSIRATIGDEQPARLSGGEFVIPSRVVSELGNGNSEAGAERLMNFIQQVNQLRTKNKDVAADTNAADLLPMPT